jgi:hypothetical protein
VIWGIGVVRWQKEGRVVDRPLLEIRVDLELDEARGGLLHIRPTCVDPTFDLRPYERLGCEQLPQLADLLRSQLQKVVDDKGVSPFVRASFEPLLSSVVSHLDAGGQYAADAMASNGGDGAHPLAIKSKPYGGALASELPTSGVAPPTLPQFSESPI